MTMQEMQRNLELYPGVGVISYWYDGRVVPYFYEDFSEDAEKGVERAARHFQALIDAGKVRRVEYIYKEENR